MERILDIGTGTGRIARKIISCSSANVIGVDINKSQIKIANKKKKMLKRYANTYDLVVADGQHLPFKGCSFDSTVCIRTLKYFSDYKLGLAEISRVLKNHGKAVLSLSNILSVDLILLRLKMLAYKRLFNFRRALQIFKDYDLFVANYRGLHKIHPKVWTISKSSTFLNFLNAAELVLQKITLKEVFSREILVKFYKVKIKGYGCSIK